MTQSILEASHVRELLPDYVLDLLSDGQRQRVEHHTSQCDACRIALRQETAVGRAVQATLRKAAEIDGRRLRVLMPTPPDRRGRGWQLAWQRHLAPVGLMLLLLFGSLGLWHSSQVNLWRNASPTYSAATATTTERPTATLAEHAGAVRTPLQATAQSSATERPQLLATPAPEAIGN